MAYKPKYVAIPLEDRVRQLLEKWQPVYNALANDSIVVDAAKELNADDGGWEGLRNLINDLIAKNRLVRSPRVTEALNEAKSNHPSYNLNFIGIENRILEKAQEVGFDITSGRDLTDAASWLIYQSGEGVPLSALGESQRREQAQEQQRKELIERITLGRDQFVLPQSAQKLFLGADHGKSINVNSARIQGESLERLKELATHVDAYRRARDSKPNTPVKPQVDGEGISVTVPAGKSIPFMGGENNLINEKTGVEFTKAEVYDLAKNNLPMFRKLMARNTKRLNEILAGKA